MLELTKSVAYRIIIGQAAVSLFRWERSADGLGKGIHFHRHEAFRDAALYVLQEDNPHTGSWRCYDTVNADITRKAELTRRAYL